MPGFKLGKIDSGTRRALGPSDVVYSYTWEITSLPFNRVFTQGNSLLNNIREKITGQSSVQIYAKDVTLPTYNFIDEKYKSASLSYKYAKEINWNDVKITFYDTRGIINLLNLMTRQTWDRNTGIRPAVEYKFDSVITVFRGDDANVRDRSIIREIEETYKLRGSWIKQLDQAPLTYESSDAHTVSVILSYDWAEYDPSE